ncbi:hypothetical protein C8F04DRAFT_1184860 [Mycena alexandri]|uniref:Uncharacterized protein n=1 Tax=Mycena alexandri TaxID=1745969 RepID=A0AAD6SS22_9AGAR|nr:hypothetical protein C8F04DRAFT_1184860 [Mycena alexandri]
MKSILSNTNSTREVRVQFSGSGAGQLRLLSCRQAVLVGRSWSRNAWFQRNVLDDLVLNIQLQLFQKFSPICCCAEPEVNRRSTQHTALPSRARFSNIPTTWGEIGYWESASLRGLAPLESVKRKSSMIGETQSTTVLRYSVIPRVEFRREKLLATHRSLKPQSIRRGSVWNASRCVKDARGSEGIERKFARERILIHLRTQTDD